MRLADSIKRKYSPGESAKKASCHTFNEKLKKACISINILYNEIAEFTL